MLSHLLGRLTTIGVLVAITGPGCSLRHLPDPSPACQIALGASPMLRDDVPWVEQRELLDELRDALPGPLITDVKQLVADNGPTEALIADQARVETYLRVACGLRNPRLTPRRVAEH